MRADLQLIACSRNQIQHLFLSLRVENRQFKEPRTIFSSPNQIDRVSDEFIHNFLL